MAPTRILAGLAGLLVFATPARAAHDDLEITGGLELADNVIRPELSCTGAGVFHRGKLPTPDDFSHWRCFESSLAPTILPPPSNGQQAVWTLFGISDGTSPQGTLSDNIGVLSASGVRCKNLSIGGPWTVGTLGPTSPRTWDCPLAAVQAGDTVQVQIFGAY